MGENEKQEDHGRKSGNSFSFSYIIEVSLEQIYATTKQQSMRDNVYYAFLLVFLLCFILMYVFRIKWPADIELGMKSKLIHCKILTNKLNIPDGISGETIL